MNNQKGFANIALIILVVVLAGVVGYFGFIRKSDPTPQQTPTPSKTSNAVYPTPTPKDETANWKTYRNEQYGFEVKYPADWQLNARDIKSPDIFGISSDELSYVNLSSLDTVDVESKARKIELLLKKTSIRKTTDLLQTDQGFSSVISLGNYQWAFGHMPEGTLGADDPEYGLIKNGMMVKVYGWGLSSRPDQAKVEQILSTFKFLR